MTTTDTPEIGRVSGDGAQAKVIPLHVFKWKIGSSGGTVFVLLMSRTLQGSNPEGVIAKNP